ncbi:hypothetical protein GO986_04900 [Deinococcus sp. HMF7620]|uniref:Uncharacterized protein n=1 Tax=Deinococcus arboris TaxID=2682977 RepID=A0A7C9LJQ8_9DEIO|nr:hypothetical protein [Deinococcus arboris]MVN86098.1 hypothetical protein [Deinococcus arboris]
MLLDVVDPERMRRLRARGDAQATQETLNWGAWLRLHRTFADWRLDVLMQGGWDGMRWEQWQTGPQALWPGQMLETIHHTPAQTAQAVLSWLGDKNRPGSASRHT